MAEQNGWDQPGSGQEPGYLPAVPGDAELEEDVVDGEIVADPAPEQRTVYVLHQVVNVFQTINIVVRHERTRAVARHGSLVGIGAVVMLRRWHRHRTFHRRMAEAAAAAGDHETALKHRQHAEVERHQRHERRVAAGELAVALAKAAPWIAGVVFGVMVAFGFLLAMAQRRLEAVAIPFDAAASLAQDAFAIAPDAGAALAIAVPVAGVAVLHHLGAPAGDLAPAWLRTAGDDDIDIAIDETTVAAALKALRVPQVTDHLKAGMPLQYLTPCRVDGRGTHFAIRLPAGVTAEKIARRRADVATGLYRSATEVWLKTGSEAGILDGWVADKGALAEGAGPYPLLEAGFTDVFKGLPFGRILRGDPTRIPVIGRNTMCGGMPEQGKSNGARVVTCGYALDVITEIRIYVPDTNFDFEHFAPRCSSYVMGAEDEYIEQISGELESLKDELQRRGQLLVDHEVQEVTREIAHAGVGLHPMFVLLEEAHVAIQHRKFGKDVSQLLCDIVKLDRKRGVHLMVSTQAPTKDSMPRDVTRNCTNGIAFAVGDHVANDALLGQGAYRAGHRATDLIPGTDRGTALCKGFSGERSEVVQVHRVQASSAENQVTPIVRRALKAMADQGRALPGTERGPLAIVSRDLLADLSTVLAHRSGKVRVAALPGMLQNLAKSWGPYRGLTGKQLRQLLEDEGVKVTNTGNVLELDVEELARVIERRERVS